MSREFIPFAQERVMSKWENVVDYNLGDSGVFPITPEELIDDPKFIEELLSTGLHHPQAAPIVITRYGAAINSTEFGMRLIREHSVEVVPGDHFGMDGYLRFSFGLPENYLREGLNRISKLIDALR